MDQQWHSVFEDSMHEPSLYFCYRFDALVVNSLTLSIPYVSCHSFFSGDFNIYSDFVFADDLWSVVTQFSLTIPCVNDDFVFSIHFRRQPWISFRCRFHASSIAQYSMTISRSIVTQFYLMIFGSAVTYCFRRFHAWAMTLLLQLILCVSREFIDAVNSIH